MVRKTTTEQKLGNQAIVYIAINQSLTSNGIIFVAWQLILLIIEICFLFLKLPFPWKKSKDREAIMPRKRGYIAKNKNFYIWTNVTLRPLCMLQMQRPSTVNIVFPRVQIQAFTVGSLKIRWAYLLWWAIWENTPKHQSVWLIDFLSEPHHHLLFPQVNKNEKGPLLQASWWGKDTCKPASYS